jgi:hypothetical protein
LRKTGFRKNLDEVNGKMEDETTFQPKYKIYQNSAIYGIITDLRTQIDSIHGLSVKAKELILEIARRLSQEEKYERSSICARIKEMLEDKVREGKITERWIEECLPSEYKRSYAKCELSSQLKKGRNVKRKGLITNKLEDRQERESPREEQEILVNIDGTNSPSLQGCDTNGHNDDQGYNELYRENKELWEALLLRDRESSSTADKLLGGEVEFMIPRERFNDLHKAMVECKRLCYVLFDIKNGVLLRAESDETRRKIRTR